MTRDMIKTIRTIKMITQKGRFLLCKNLIEEKKDEKY